MRGWFRVLMVVGGLALAGTARAQNSKSSSTLIALQLTQGIADFTGLPAGGYIGAYSHSELGAQLQLWRFYNPEYAVVVGGGIGFFNETDKPGSAALPGSTDFKYSQKSWQVRLGADRFFHLTDRSHLYMGPGIQYWSGKAKFDGGGFTPAVETPNTTRWAIEARIGYDFKLSPKYGIITQIGQYFAYATSKYQGAKATWWPSGHDGAIGLSVAY